MGTEITRRHIPLAWQKFYVEAHDVRRKRMCTRRGVSRYEGIPGITPQAIVVNEKPGWCPECITALSKWYIEHYKEIVTIPEAHAVYNIVFWEMMRFMKHWHGAEGL